jgi:hypothetical protein
MLGRETGVSPPFDDNSNRRNGRLISVLSRIHYNQVTNPFRKSERATTVKVGVESAGARKNLPAAHNPVTDPYQE